MNNKMNKVVIGFAKSITPLLAIVIMIQYHQTEPLMAYFGVVIFIIGNILNELIFTSGEQDE